MPYQQAIFANNQFYHVFNRGVEKRRTFLNKRDYNRFIATLEYYRYKNPPTRFSFKERPILLQNKKGTSLLVEVVSFCLMPTHFHLLLKQVEDGGVTKFLSKATNSYTKYFNTKNKRVGPLFQGAFKAVWVGSDEELIHVSRYIHLNPLIDYLAKDLKTYPYSSYPETLGLRKGFCSTEEILNFFQTSSYEKFVLDQENYGRSLKFIERLLFDMEK